MLDDGVGLPLGWTLENSEGLGLSITRRTHCRACIPTGTAVLWCSNREEGGTEVEISLPLRLMERKTMNARSLEPIHVLVVDDEAPARQRLIDLLAKDDAGGVSERSRRRRRPRWK